MVVITHTACIRIALRPAQPYAYLPPAGMVEPLGAPWA